MTDDQPGNPPMSGTDPDAGRENRDPTLLDDDQETVSSDVPVPEEDEEHAQEPPADAEGRPSADF